MSRILLVDDSPHAQRMGERILSDEGYEVVTVSNADSALIRLEDADPDVVVADAVMPGRTGYDICQYLRMSPRHRHVRVILTSGAQEPIDEARAQLVQADGALRKPFEASALLAAVKPLAEAAQKERPASPGPGPRAAGADRAPRAGESVPFVAVVDAEQVRAAVTLALDAAMGTMVDEIACRVLAALNASKPQAQPELPQPALPPPLPQTPREMVRRVTPRRVRAGSILGLDIDNLEPEDSTPDPRPLAPNNMPDNTFDVVSKIEMPEVLNAIQQALKEIHQRYDLKDSKSNIELNEKDNQVVLSSQDEFKLKAVVDLLESKLVRRKVPLKGLTYGEIIPAAGPSVRQEISLQQGIPIEKAREIVKKIKESKLRVQASIQGDFVRVASRDRDTLQQVIKLLRETDFGIDTQFTNYRTN